MTAAARARRPIRLALVASGGGHLRQLLDLEPVWSAHDHFFVTEDTPLGRSIAERERTYFVSHFALGQARLGRPLRMFASAIRNLFASASLMLRERPDIVITTGAGAAFFSVLWGRVLGSKIVLIESFARFDRLSLFGRLTAPLAHYKVVQSALLASQWPDAAVFDPLRLLPGERPAKEALLFATVGAILSFDRLVNLVAELKKRGDVPERVVIQTGVGGAAPEGIETFETASFAEMQKILEAADVVVCHGGTGSLITALREGCRVVAVPRLHKHGEVYDDHQAEIVQAFVNRGLVQSANTLDELSTALVRARSSVPKRATTDPAELRAHLQRIIADHASSP